MTLVDKTARSQGESISFEFDLQHAPEKVWRALTDRPHDERPHRPHTNGKADRDTETAKAARA